MRSTRWQQAVTAAAACLLFVTSWYVVSNIESSIKDASSEAAGTTAEAGDGKQNESTEEDSEGKVPSEGEETAEAASEDKMGPGLPLESAEANSESGKTTSGSGAAKKTKNGNKAKPVTTGAEPASIPVQPTNDTISLIAGKEAVATSQGYAELAQAIHKVEEDGYHVGIEVEAIDGTSLISYRSDSPLYPASSIKGPYVISLWREKVGDGSPSSYLSRKTEAVLGWSDNDAYRSLQESFGPGTLQRMAVESGCDLSWYGGSEYGWGQWYYPHTSPHDLARLWVTAYRYIVTNTGEGAAELRAYDREREVSPLADALPSIVTTYAKAGWLSEGGDYEATPAAADAGIVIWPTGRQYVVAIMTDTEADLDTVEELAHAVDRCHYAMSVL